MEFFEVLDIVKDCKFGELKFTLEPNDDVSQILYIEGTEADHQTGELKTFKGREYYIGPHMTKPDLIRTCFVAVLAWVEHEAREEFTYRGRDVMQPHFDIE